MDSKFQNILTLALRPETGDGEAVAALNAARRMVARQGLDTVLKGQVTEKVVYRDRVVYREKRADTRENLAWQIGAKHQRYWLRQLFYAAEKLEVDIKVVELQGSENVIISPLWIEVTACGTNHSVQQFRKYMASVLLCIRNDHLGAFSEKPETPFKKKSWWKRLFG